ncbi:MAG: exonuclease domain-containing protein [Bacteroidetes bacterium]|nr:exonuclease domain-containing protein [Bacteroidota bacterium]
MFSIVDIETTGGYGTKNCITEIAIILHNGQEVEGSYTTLVNPESPINWYVQNMTGITDAMVSTAPKFNDVAPHIYNLIKDRVFIAHNVNFDYSFVKQHLKNAGYDIDLPKICTVRLSRKIFPGLPKYGLGSLSKHFNITNTARHRAIGDAQATTKLFELILANDKNNEVDKLTKRRKALQYLPPNLINTSVAEKIPSLPGVYYFYNNKEKIIYVGKAVNLKKRITSHFSNNKTSKQKQDFLKEIYNISWKECSSDLTAQIFESIEIKRLWPKFNKSQKHYERQYGIFIFEDSLGYKRLAIDNKKKILQPLQSFGLLVEARQFLTQLCKDFDIHLSMFFLSKEVQENMPSTKNYNKKIDEIIQLVAAVKQTYLVHDSTGNYILMEQGKFWGMGKIESKKAIESFSQKVKSQKLKIKEQQKTSNKQQQTIESIKQHLTQYPENFTALSYINNYILSNPQSVIMLE